MKRIHRLSLAAAFAGAAASAPAAHACSMVLFPTFRDGVHLLATATADTVLAGAAGMEYRVERGRAERAVYGQVATVQRVGGTGAGAVPAATERVVLVPWGYDESCARTLWTASARWVEPGMRGVLWGSLRPREHWVDGMPTFDVRDPYQQPYAPRRWRHEASPLDEEQLFELLQLLPSSDERGENPETAMQPLLAWAHAHPELARRFPAKGMVEEAEYQVRLARLRRIDPPLAGTYRFTVSVDGDAPRTFYARTRSAPHTEWDPAKRPGAAGRQRPAMDDPFPGYTLPLAGSRSVDSLPVVWGPGQDLSRGGYVAVAAVPEPGMDGVRVWRGDVDLGFAARALLGDPVLAGIMDAVFDELNRRMREGGIQEEPVRAPARFRLEPDGAVTVEQTIVLHDGRMIVIRGERVSRVTIREPGPAARD